MNEHWDDSIVRIDGDGETLEATYFYGAKIAISYTIDEDAMSISQFVLNDTVGGMESYSSEFVQPDGGGARIVRIERTKRMPLFLALGFWLSDFSMDYAVFQKDALEGNESQTIKRTSLDMLRRAQARLPTV